MDHPARGRIELIGATLFSILAVAFAVIAVVAVWRYGWTELYADQWRLYRIYLEQPFPANVLALENGHRPIFPGLVRVAELHWFNGNQVLQLAVGLLNAKWLDSCRQAHRTLAPIRLDSGAK